MKGTWQTTDGGGGGLAAAVVIGAAVLAVAIAGPVAAAVAAVAEALVITIAVLGALVLLGGAVFAAYRVRRGPERARGWQANHIRVSHLPPAPRPPESLPGPRPRAIGAPRHELHLHFHGVTAEDVAAIIARQDGGGHR
jgi:hypothetical protein